MENDMNFEHLRPVRVMVACALLALVPLAQAFDYGDDEDGDTVTYATSPQDIYEARLDLLKRQSDAQRDMCRRSDSRARGYCQMEVDQKFKEGKRALEEQRDKALAAEAAKKGGN
jgi:hypothetical protein